MKRCAIAGLLTLLTVGAAQAQQQEVTLANDGLQPRIEALSERYQDHAFEIGMLRSLRAIEKSLQTRYRYGIGDAVIAFPGLRLQVGPQNPSPEPAEPKSLTRIMNRLLADLVMARADLSSAEGNIAPFVLTLQDVWFDVNANGTRDDSEGAMEALAPLLLGRGALQELEAQTTPIEVRFDAADHAWLTAYTHMLSGAASLFAAFDPSFAMALLADGKARMAEAPQIANTFDQDALRAEIEALRVEESRLDATLETLLAEQDQLRAEIRALRQAEPRDEAALAEANTRMRALTENRIAPLGVQRQAIQREVRAATAKLSTPQPSMAAQFRPQLDAVWVVLTTLRQQPYPDRIAGAREHWLEMIAQNRIFWAALNEETDNDREWIPNPQQISALGIEVPAELADGWQAVLADAEALLEGRLLLPHPLLPEGLGIDLRAYAADPGPIDPVDWIHGIGAAEYVARGPMITRQRWFAFRRLTRGNAGGFALFFN